MKIIIIFILLFTQISCSYTQDRTSKIPSKSARGDIFSKKPLIVCPDKADCFGADIRLSIISLFENDTSTVYKAVAVYNDKNLGLLVFIPKAKEDSKGFGKKDITIKSIGKESDDLLELMATLYKQKIARDAKFTPSVSASYVNLSEFAKSVAGSQDKDSSTIDEYKLFFENKTDEAELYLNINPKDKWIELREKDPEFRATIIEILKK
jgi:hypothetical protein